MNIQTVLLAVLIALGFTSWPIAGNYLKACSGWVGTIVMMATAVVVALLSIKQFSTVPALNVKAILLLIIVGIINGVSVYLYSVKVADATIPTAAFMVTVSILMAVSAPFLNWIINSAVPNPQQVVGFGLAAAAIYFLGK